MESAGINGGGGEGEGGSEAKSGVWGADVVMTVEGNIAGGVMPESLADPVRLGEPVHVGLFMRENREIRAPG